MSAVICRNHSRRFEPSLSGFFVWTCLITVFIFTMGSASAHESWKFMYYADDGTPATPITGYWNGYETDTWAAGDTQQADWAVGYGRDLVRPSMGFGLRYPKSGTHPIYAGEVIYPDGQANRYLNKTQCPEGTDAMGTWRRLNNGQPVFWLYNGSGSGRSRLHSCFTTDGTSNTFATTRSDCEGIGAYVEDLGYTIQLYDGNGAFLTSDVVRQLGSYYANFGTYGGEPSADAMDAIDALKSAIGDAVIYGVAVQGAESFSADLLEYAAHASGGLSFAATDADELEAALSDILQDSTCGGTRETLAVDYGANGTFVWDGSVWTNISGWNPENLTGWNGSLIGDYGANGTFLYDGAAWTNISSLDPELVVAWNDLLAVDYGSFGTFVYDGSAWTAISNWDPENLTAWGDRLVADYGPDGTFIYDGAAWFNVSGLNPESMTSWGDRLAVDYGAVGTFVWDGAAWTNISSLNPDSLTAWGDNLAADYGGHGTFIFDGTTWFPVSGLDPESMTSWGDRLVADYGTYGTFAWDGVGWENMSSLNPDEIISWNEDLAADFGTAGTFVYDGSSWLPVSNWDPEQMTTY